MLNFVIVAKILWKYFSIFYIGTLEVHFLFRDQQKNNIFFYLEYIFVAFICLQSPN